MKTLLVLGIIALFFGLAFIPSFNAVSISKKDNHPPNKPIIIGPNGGKPGISYTFNFNAVDPDGDNVSYFIKWGDGTTYGWTPYFCSGINVPIAHTWDYICDCPIRVKAKDIYGKEGEWSDLIIRINRNKPQIIDIEYTKDCDCQSNKMTHLADKILNKLEKNEVISNVIDLSNPQDDRPICDFLYERFTYFDELCEYYKNQMREYPDYSLGFFIYYSLLCILKIRMDNLLKISAFFNCDMGPYCP